MPSRVDAALTHIRTQKVAEGMFFVTKGKHWHRLLLVFSPAWMAAATPATWLAIHIRAEAKNKLLFKFVRWMAKKLNFYWINLPIWSMAHGLRCS
jgi:hypothetical protein